MTLSLAHRRLDGLSSNPVFCDCNARALQRWLQDKVRAGAAYGDLSDVRCAAPDALAGKLLADLPADELSCEGRTTTTTTELEFLADREAFVHLISPVPRFVLRCLLYFKFANYAERVN